MESLQSMETITEVWNTNTLKLINMCDTPYYKVVEEPYKQVIELPCGKCLKCKTKTQFQWLFRLQQELQDSYSAYFVTLTYNERNLPRSEEHHVPTLDYTDVQKFIKRLRKRIYKKEADLNIKRKRYR